MSILSIPRAEFLIQQLQLITSLRTTDRIWVSRAQVLERDTNRGILSALQRTLCFQSRNTTIGALRHLYDNTLWWLQFFSNFVISDEMPSNTSNTSNASNDPRTLRESLIMAVRNSLTGLDALKASYSTDLIFALKLDFLKNHIITTFREFLQG